MLFKSSSLERNIVRQIICGALLVLIAACGQGGGNGGGGSGPTYTSPLVEVANQKLGMFSTVGTTYSAALVGEKLLPKGSAFVTDSGNLKNGGIAAIIHAVVGSLTKSGSVYDPSLESLRNSVKNSMLLAKRYGYSTVAIPMLNEKTFLNKLGAGMSGFSASKYSLAREIIEGALEGRSGLKIVFVVTPGEYYSFFDTEFKNILSNPKWAVVGSSVQLKAGTLIRYSLHKATAIVHFSDMDVQFGKDGVSKLLAEESDSEAEVHSEATQLTQEFSKSLLDLSTQAPVPEWKPTAGGNQPTAPALTNFPLKPVAMGKLDCERFPFLCIPDDEANSFYGVTFDIGLYRSVQVPHPTHGGLVRTLQVSAVPGSVQVNSVNPGCSAFFTSRFPNADSIRNFLVSLSHPALTPLYFYRWGDKVPEEARIGVTPPFDFRYLMNFGGTAAGKGMYVAENPVTSATYGNDALPNAGLVTYVVPAGARVLYLDDAAIRNAITTAGLVSTVGGSPESVVLECNPPLMVGHYQGGTWWALKDNQGVTVEDFTGRYRTLGAAPLGNTPLSDYNALNPYPALQALYKLKCNVALNPLCGALP